MWLVSHMNSLALLVLLKTFGFFMSHIFHAVSWMNRTEESCSWSVHVSHVLLCNRCYHLTPRAYAMVCNGSPPPLTTTSAAPITTASVHTEMWAPTAPLSFRKRICRMMEREHYLCARVARAGELSLALRMGAVVSWALAAEWAEATI